MEIYDIMVPAFATDLIAKTRCDDCGVVGKWWIKAAGARLDGENRACFSTTLWCSECESKREIVFSTRPFFRPEWWFDVAAWFGDGARPDRVGAVLRELPFMGDLTVPYRKGRSLHHLRLYGGYAGEVGPVVLIYRRKATHPQNTYGVVRLEPKDRLRFLPVSDPEAMAVTKWTWFCGLPESAEFDHKGRVWTKLSYAHIKGIVQDRVFTQWTSGHRKSVVRKGRKRSPERAHRMGNSDGTI